MCGNLMSTEQWCVWEHDVNGAMVCVGTCQWSNGACGNMMSMEQWCVWEHDVNGAMVCVGT